MDNLIRTKEVHYDAPTDRYWLLDGAGVDTNADTGSNNANSANGDG